MDKFTIKIDFSKNPQNDDLKMYKVGTSFEVGVRFLEVNITYFYIGSSLKVGIIVYVGISLKFRLKF